MEGVPLCPPNANSDWMTSMKLPKFFRRSTETPSSPTSCASPCRSPTISFRETSSLAKALCSEVRTPGRKSYFSVSGYGAMQTDGQSAVVELILSLTIGGTDFATLRINLPSVQLVGDPPRPLLSDTERLLSILVDPMDPLSRRAAEAASATTPSSETRGNSR